MNRKSPALFLAIGLLLIPAFAFAADAPAAAPAAPAAPIAAPAAAAQLSPAGEAPCADSAFSFLLPVSADLGGVCGACSAKACVGLPELGTCGSGLRCIPQGTCSSAGTPKCNCLIT